jgi:hypothetical protein
VASCEGSISTGRNERRGLCRRGDRVRAVVVGGGGVCGGGSVRCFGGRLAPGRLWWGGVRVSGDGSLGAGLGMTGPWGGSTISDPRPGCGVPRRRVGARGGCNGGSYGRGLLVGGGGGGGACGKGAGGGTGRAARPRGPEGLFWGVVWVVRRWIWRVGPHGPGLGVGPGLENRGLRRAWGYLARGAGRVQSEQAAGRCQGVASPNVYPGVVEGAGVSTGV